MNYGLKMILIGFRICFNYNVSVLSQNRTVYSIKILFQFMNAKISTSRRDTLAVMTQPMIALQNKS